MESFFRRKCVCNSCNF